MLSVSGLATGSFQTVLSRASVRTEELQPEKENDSTKLKGPQNLSDEEKKEVQQLKERDREVRAHEQAHLNALGRYRSGGAKYQFEKGPDGRQYAVAGEVPVDVSPEDTPEKTVEKAKTIRRAALAPAEPSAADRAVAAQAQQLEAQAQAELQKERNERAVNATEENAPTGPQPSDALTETARASISTLGAAQFFQSPEQAQTRYQQPAITPGSLIAIA